MFFKGKDPEETSSSKEVVVIDKPKATQAVIPTPLVDSLDAEIRWALKMVTMHASFRSCLNLNELFSTMFPDSDFKMSKTKAAY